MDDVTAESRGGMTAFGTRKINVHLREIDRENLATIRAMLSPRDPSFVSESEVIRYCLRKTREREVPPPG